MHPAKIAKLRVRTHVHLARANEKKMSAHAYARMLERLLASVVNFLHSLPIDTTPLLYIWPTARGQSDG